MRSRAGDWLRTPLGRIVLLLAAVRAAVPLVALAGSGRDLPLLPPYDYAPLNGDSYGFYSAMRAVIAAAPRVHPALVVVDAVALAGAALCLQRTWNAPRRRWIGLLAAAIAASVGASTVVSAIEQTGGAAVVGWPLVWAVLLFPLRLAGLGPDEDLTFAVGLALSLVCVAVTTAATALLALRLTGSRVVAAASAALWALWPLYVAPLAGRSAWENGQWNVDVGLHLYTEPFSTALVTCALVLVATLRPGPTQAVVAGSLLGYATVVKLSNGILAVVVVICVAAVGAWAAAALIAAGAVAWTPLVVAYWPKGYVGIFGGQIAAEEEPFALRYAGPGWGDSLLFTPRFLAIVGPLLLLGAVLARTRARWLLASPIALTAAFYTFYLPFPVHPRFLYVVLPAALVLVALALTRLATLAFPGKLMQRGPPSRARRMNRPGLR